MLELLGLVEEVVRVGLGNEATLVRLLDKVFVALLLGEGNGVLLRLELDVGALHAVGGRLPAHERVLPAVTALQDVPVHAPVVLVPGTRLCRGLSGAVDTVISVSRRVCMLQRAFIPDSTGLEIGGSAGENGAGKRVTGLAAVHDALGHWGKLPCSMG